MEEKIKQLEISAVTSRKQKENLEIELMKSKQTLEEIISISNTDKSSIEEFAHIISNLQEPTNVK